MKKLTFFQVATVLLLLINIALLGFFLSSKKGHKGPHPSGHASSSALEMLELNAEQHRQFEKYAEEHKTKVHELARDQKKLLEKYFDDVKNDAMAQADTNLIGQWQRLEAKKLDLTYQHLKEVQALLEPEQMKHFEKFLEHIEGRVLTQREEKLPPPRRKMHPSKSKHKE